MQLVKGSFELQNGDETVLVQLDPAMEANTVRAGSFDLIQRLFGAAQSGNGRSTQRMSKRGAAGFVRKSEWHLNDEQLQVIATGVSNEKSKLSDIERKILRARFLSDPARTTSEIASELGIRNKTEVTLYTRKGLRHLGIRVPKLRRAKRSKR